VWAAVENLTPGNDQLAAGEFISVTPTVVTIRYIGIAPSWTPITDYLGRALVVDANLNLQQAQSSGGLSGATAPAWNPETNGYTAGDGDPSTGVTWKNLGPASTRTGVRAGMLVTWNSKIFQIKSVNNPDNRSKMLILICTEINDSMQQSSTTGGTGSGYQNINLPPGGIDGGQF
jgi:head-tail adaptor